MKGFDDHLDNYGDPDPGFDPAEDERLDALAKAAWEKEQDEHVLTEEEHHDMFHIPEDYDDGYYDDGITVNDFDNWPMGREFPS